MRAELTTNLDIDITALIDMALASSNPVMTILDSGLFSRQDKDTPLYRLYYPLKQKRHQELLLPILEGLIRRHPKCEDLISLENAGLIFQLLNPQDVTNIAEIITQLCDPDSPPAQMEAISTLAGLMEIDLLCQRIATDTPKYAPKIALGAGMTCNREWCTQLTAKDPALEPNITLGAGLSENIAWCVQVAGTDQNKWHLIGFAAGHTENIAWCEQIAEKNPDGWKYIAEGAGRTENIAWCEQVAEKNPDGWKHIAKGAGRTENIAWCEQVAEKNPDGWKHIAKGAGRTENIAWCEQVAEKNPDGWKHIAEGAGRTENIAWCEQVAEKNPDGWKHIAEGAGRTGNMDWCVQIHKKNPDNWKFIARGVGQTENIAWCERFARTDQNKWTLIALDAGQSANMDWCEQVAGTDQNLWGAIAHSAGHISKNMAWCTQLTAKDPALEHRIALGAGRSADMDWCKQIAGTDQVKWMLIAQGAGTSDNMEWCQQLAKQDPNSWTNIARGALLNNYIAFGQLILDKANAHKDVSYPALIETLIRSATEPYSEANLIDLLRATPHPLESSSRDTETARNNYRDFFKMCSNLGQYTLENPLSMVTFYNQFPTELLAGGDESPPEENHLKITKICQSIISIREENGCSSLTAEQLAHAAYENTPLALRTPLVFFSALYHSSARHDKKKVIPAHKVILAHFGKHILPFLNTKEQRSSHCVCKLKEKEPLWRVLLPLFDTHILPVLTTNWTHKQYLPLQPMFERKYAAAQHLEQKIKKQFKMQATCIAYLLGLNKLTIRTAADLSAKDTRLIADIFFHKLLKDFILKYVGMSTRPLTPQIKRTKEWATGFLKKNNPLNITEASYTKFDLLMRHTKKDRDSIKTSLSEEKLTRVGDAGTPPPGSDYQLLLLGGGATSPALLKQLVDSCRILQSFYDSQTDTSAPFSRSTVDRRLFGPPSEDTLERIVDTRTPTERKTELKNASKITALENIAKDLRGWAFYP